MSENSAPDESEGLLHSRDDGPKIEPQSSRFLVVGLFVLVSILGGYSIDLLQSAEETSREVGKECSDFLMPIVFHSSPNPIQIQLYFT